MAGMDVLKALAVLADSGIELSDEQRESLKVFKASAMREAATKILDRKVIGDDETHGESVDAWVSNMFDLADSMSNEIKGSTVGRGRGEVFERVFRIDTPAGTLKVSLTGESDESDETDES